MKLVTFSYQSQSRVGVLAPDGESIFDCTAQCGSRGDMIGLLSRGQAGMETVREALADAAPRSFIPRQAVTLLAPISNPGKIIGLGHNYYDHMGLGLTEPPQYPTFFGKFAHTVIGPGQAVRIPPVTDQVDYEAELAVVIGRTARRVSRQEAYDFVAGYTIFNDVSARDYQKRTSQWMIGKNFDTFGPMGPALVTRDEIPDPHTLDLRLTLNGREMQHASTASMIFSIPYLIETLSAVLTLEPGDVISTGTPAKTELAHTVEPYMHPGDVVEIAIEGIGVLRNPVEAGD